MRRPHLRLERNARNALRGSLALLVLIALDRASKAYLIQYAQSDFEQGFAREILYPSLHAGGIGMWHISETALTIIWFAAFVILSLLLMHTLQRMQLRAAWGIGLVMIGAFSNMIDRVAWGGVLDYLYFSPMLPIINLSDIFIVIGTLFALDALRTRNVKPTHST